MSVESLQSLLAKARQERRDIPTTLNNKKAEWTNVCHNLDLAAKNFAQVLEQTMKRWDLLVTKLDDDQLKLIAAYEAEKAQMQEKINQQGSILIGLKTKQVGLIPTLNAQLETELRKIATRIESEQKQQVLKLQEQTNQAKAELDRLVAEAERLDLSAAKPVFLHYDEIDQEIDIGFQGDWSEVLNLADPVDKQFINLLSDMNTDICNQIYQVLIWKKSPTLSRFQPGQSGITLDFLISAMKENNLSEREGEIFIPAAVRGKREMHETVYYSCEENPEWEFKVVKDVASIDSPRLVLVEVVPAIKIE